MPVGKTTLAREILPDPAGYLNWDVPRGRDVELRYFRDVDGREVDFVLTDRRGPTHLIEVKWSDRPVDKGLRYMHARFSDAAALQISATGTDDYRTPDGIRVQPALSFLTSLV